jgi:hypothetical protein
MQKRQGRLGRGQNAKDTPTPATNGASPAPNNDAPSSPQISVTNGVNNGHESSDGATGSKNGKSKNWRLEKLSWTDIRRPASAMQNYIAQRQVEMAVEKKSPAPAVQSPSTNDDPSQEKDEMKGAPHGEDGESTFKKMSTLQMMDDLSRDLVHWQRMIAGQAGDK